MTAGSSLTALARDVDPHRLRATLEEIRSALRSRAYAVMGTVAEAALYDREEILESLKIVVATLERVDLRRPPSTPSPPAVFGGAGQVDRLRQMLLALQPSWLALVLSKLGQRKVATLGELLATPSPDLLGLLGRADDENAHSDVLRWLLDPGDAKTIAPAALRRLAVSLDPPDSWESAFSRSFEMDCISVRREYIIGREWTAFGGDRIDIVISGADFVLAIENKLWSVEHDAQTLSYWRWLETLPGLRAGVYLTPTGMSAYCPSFRAMSYLDLLSCLLEAPAATGISATEQIVLSSYVKTLYARVLSSGARITPRVQVGRSV